MNSSTKIIRQGIDQQNNQSLLIGASLKIVYRLRKMDYFAEGAIQGERIAFWLHLYGNTNQLHEKKIHLFCSVHIAFTCH